MSVVKPTPKQLQWPIARNTNNKRTNENHQIHVRNQRQERENARDQVTILHLIG